MFQSVFKSRSPIETTEVESLQSDFTDYEPTAVEPPLPVEEVFDPNESPLAYAVRRKELSFVILLLTEEKEDPNPVDIFGETPLFDCIASQNVDRAPNR